jgi:hypothetical protein
MRMASDIIEALYTGEPNEMRGKKWADSPVV